MGIGTFGAFTQARLAIYAAQTGLSVTGNNISNINTPGYTRQRLNQVSLYAAGADRYYAEGDIRTGQGALVKSLSQIRSPYLDIRYRTENAKLGYQDGRMEGLDEIKQILDEVGKGDESKGEKGFGVLGLEFSELAAALKDLTSETGHQEYDNTVRQYAQNLVQMFNNYASDLEEVRENTVAKLNQNLEKVNEHLDIIRSLNEEIRKCEIHGDPALELRDSRNLEIDALSELIDINVTYSEEEIAAGVMVEKLTISLDNINPDKSVKTDESLLVDGVFSAHINLGVPMTNPYYGVKLDEPSEALDALNKLLDEKAANGEIADLDEMAKMRQAYVSSPYLNQVKDADGNVIKETPVADIRDATVLTDKDNPYYGLMITELKNKKGDLHVGGNLYAAEAVEAADLPAGLTWNVRTNRASTEEAGVPAEGDTTVTFYTRTLKPNVTNNPPQPDDYTYTKQVYEKLVTKPVALDDNDISGKIQAFRELLTEEGEFTDEGVITNIDEKAGSKRGISYYQKTLDLLAKQFAKVMNDTNQGFLRDPDGNFIQKGTNDQGKEIGVPITVITLNGEDQYLNKDWEKMKTDTQNEIKKQIGVDGLTDQELKDAKISETDMINAYLKGQTYDATTQKFIPENKDDVLDENGAVVEPGWGGNAKGIHVGEVLFSNNPDNDDPSEINASNISISDTWSKNHVLVCALECPPGDLEPASGQSDNIRHFEYVVGEQKFDFFPTDLEGCEGASEKAMFNGTFFEMWNNIGTTLGADQNYTGTMLEANYQNVLSIDTQRDSVSSVDFNDEAMNLMMYAKSYNAACRMMTTIDSVLDKLINNTGMTT